MVYTTMNKIALIALSLAVLFNVSYSMQDTGFHRFLDKKYLPDTIISGKDWENTDVPEVTLSGLTNYAIIPHSCIGGTFTATPPNGMVDPALTWRSYNYSWNDHTWEYSYGEIQYVNNDRGVVLNPVRNWFVPGYNYSVQMSHLSTAIDISTDPCVYVMVAWVYDIGSANLPLTSIQTIFDTRKPGCPAKYSKNGKNHIAYQVGWVAIQKSGLSETAAYFLMSDGKTPKEHVNNFNLRCTKIPFPDIDLCKYNITNNYYPERGSFNTDGSDAWRPVYGIRNPPI